VAGTLLTIIATITATVTITITLKVNMSSHGRIMCVYIRLALIGIGRQIDENNQGRIKMMNCLPYKERVG
jgi:hypothetical protein